MMIHLVRDTSLYFDRLKSPMFIKLKKTHMEKL